MTYNEILLIIAPPSPWRDSAESLLNSRGYFTIKASDCLEAYTISLERRIDIAIMHCSTLLNSNCWNKLPQQKDHYCPLPILFLIEQKNRDIFETSRTDELADTALSDDRRNIPPKILPDCELYLYKYIQSDTIYILEGLEELRRRIWQWRQRNSWRYRRFFSVVARLTGCDSDAAKLAVETNDRSNKLSDRSESDVYCSRNSISLPIFIKVASMGQLKVIIDGRELQEDGWLTAKSKHLFVYILCHPQGVREDAVLEEFWPKRWDTGRQNLYVTISAIRKSLRTLYPAISKEIISHSRGLLRWNVGENTSFDVLQIRQWYRQLSEIKNALDIQPKDTNAKAQSIAETIEAQKILWTKIVEMFRGPFFPSCSQSWAEDVRTEMNGILRDSLLNLSTYCCANSEYDKSLSYAKHLLSIDPLEQKGCELAITSHLKLGHPERAMVLYRQFCPRLRHELGIEPNISLTKLYYQARLGISYCKKI